MDSRLPAVYLQGAVREGPNLGVRNAALGYAMSDEAYSFVQAESDDSLDAHRSSLATSRSAEGADGQQRTARKFGQTPASTLNGGRRSKRAGAMHALVFIQTLSRIVCALLRLCNPLDPSNSQRACCTITKQVRLCQCPGWHTESACNSLAGRWLTHRA